MAFRIVPLVMLAVSFAALRAAAQTPVTAPPLLTAACHDSSVTIALIGFFSSLVALSMQMWREHRNKLWEREQRAEERARDKEDREEARREARAERGQLHAETVATATELAKLTRKQHEKLAEWIAQIKAEQTEVLHKAITENTALTHEVGRRADAAYEAGNNFAQRLESIQDTLGAGTQKLKKVAVTVDDTHAIVEDIAASTGDSGGKGKNEADSDA